MRAFHLTPRVWIWLEFVEPNCEMRTAPVPHQQSATNAIKGKRKHSEINEADRFTAAHNALVAGSSPAGPTTTKLSNGLRHFPKLSAFQRFGAIVLKLK
jgi:hypothetical protein